MIQYGDVEVIGDSGYGLSGIHAMIQSTEVTEDQYDRYGLSGIHAMIQLNDTKI